jgi:hypothetical protein
MDTLRGIHAQSALIVNHPSGKIRIGPTHTHVWGREIVGNYEDAGNSQSVLIMIKPIISPVRALLCTCLKLATEILLWRTEEWWPSAAA